MLKIKRCTLPSNEQWDMLIMGMRNPLNSWNKSDTNYLYGEMIVGENDLKLMRKLVKGGTNHRKFMRMIPVYVDIVAPLYWWKEFDTYKVGVIANSCSTMHKIHEKEFTLDDFSIEHLMDGIVGTNDLFNPYKHFCNTISCLNACRLEYLQTKDKIYWWQMIQLLPSSYNQKRTVMLNYEVLSNIYHNRNNHKLNEWLDFCDWIETLPYCELIVGGM